MVRAQIRRIDSYSAHADQTELAEWIAARAPVRGTLFLDHGEEASLEGLRKIAVQRLPETNVTVPEIGEQYALPPGAPARRLKTGRVDVRDALGRDWQNSYADFVTGLKRELAKIDDQRQREAAIKAMRKVLDDYAAHREQRRGRRHT